MTARRRLAESLALGLVPQFVQDTPEHPRRDAEHKVAMSVLPNGQLCDPASASGAVANRADPHRQAGQVVLADLERAEEALKALVVGLHLGLAAPKPQASSARLTLRTLSSASRNYSGPLSQDSFNLWC